MKRRGMGRHYLLKAAFYICIALGAFALSSCSESPQSTGLDATHGGIAVTVVPASGTATPAQLASVLPVAALGDPTAPTFDCVGMGIGVMTVNVKDSGGTVVKGQDFSCQRGNGTIDNIPNGSGYQVEIIGRPQQGGATIWFGNQAPVTVGGGTITPVTIANFAPTFDTLDFTLSPSSIAVGATTTVTGVTMMKNNIQTPVFQNFPPLGMQFFSSPGGSCSGNPTPDARVVVEANGTVTAIGGTGTVTICAGYAGRTKAKTLMITPATGPLPPFVLTASQTVFGVYAGGATQTINVAAIGLTGIPQLTLSVACPVALLCAVSDTGQQPNNTLYPNTSPGTSFQVTVGVNPNYTDSQGNPASVPPGFYLMTVKGVATGFTVAATYTLAVQVIPPVGSLPTASGDLVVTIAPGVRNLPYGQALSANYTVVVTLQNGAGGPVTLTPTGCPTGSCVFESNPITVTPTAPMATTTLTVPTTATTSGSIPITIQAATAQATALLTLTQNVPESWSATGSLTTARVLHTATLLPNGKVLVGGSNSGDALASASAELFTQFLL